MNTLRMLEAFLYQLSAVFFYPVILGLFFLLGRSFYSLGLFCREGWGRLRQPDVLLASYAKAIESLPVSGMMELQLAAILQQAEEKSNRYIQRARYSIKMGPTLGLIGTLTPMARALSNLSQGNLGGLSNQMITAFSTTVLGLIVGGLAYSIAHVRVRWQRHDVFILSRLAEEKLQTAA